MYFDGRIEAPSQKDRRELHCKRVIAEVLRNHGIMALEETILLDEPIVQDQETFSHLKNKTLPYPPSPSNQTLHNLTNVWRVKGYAKQEPTLKVELLVGEYKTFPDIELLGKRNGLVWVSSLL